MNRLVRVLLIIIAILIVLLVIAGAAAAVTARRPFPTTDGRVTVPGLREEVNIYWDEYGIPHIYANNQDDLFFAQGYVHAQDRFWQMEFWRHIGQGRLSEIVGEATVESDMFIRTFGWNRIAADMLAYYEAEAPEVMAILDAYSAGVNAYVDTHRNELSLNYTILGLVNEPWEIEPWTPINTLSWAVVMSDNLSGNWSEEIDRTNLVKTLGESTVANLLPLYPFDKRPVIAPTADLVNDLPQALRPGGATTAIEWHRVNTRVRTQPALTQALGSGPFLGSNNWVVAGEHTATGLPLLANDPHLGIQMPAIWYEVGLHAPGWDMRGFSFAGVPGIIIGHNDRIAWGVTNVGADVQDLYIEKINPSNPNQYEYQGQWEDMEVIQEVIRVNGGEDVTLNVRVTRHGPIINDVVDDLTDPLAFKWTAQEPSRIMQSVLLLNQAKNYDDFREALRYWDIPSLNVVYADVDGNIAYQMPGLVPVRPTSNGLLPVPGWTGEHEWEGWIPYEELPAMFNPDEGYIVTANNAVVDEDYPRLISLYWADGDRAERIRQILQAAIDDGTAITADTFATIQFDNRLLLADTYVPLFTNLSSSDAKVQAALERLRGWDRQMSRDSVPAALFAVFYRQLARNVLADEVGAEHVDTVANGIFFHALADQPAASWWDNTTTEASETREDILLQALTDTIRWFEENVGDDMNEWTWGNLHTSTFVSVPLGQSGVGLIESIVNRGPFPTAGSSTTVNATSWRWSNPAEVTGHPSMRMIVDMSDFDASRSVIPTGQSGHPYHRHYDDQIELWLNGQTHAMWFSQEAVQAAAGDHLVLQPGQ